MTKVVKVEAQIFYVKTEEVAVILTPEEVEGLSEVEMDHLIQDRAHEKIAVLTGRIRHAVSGLRIHDIDGPHIKK